MSPEAPAAAAARPRRLHITPEEMPARPGRIPSLDGLRAISVLIVLGAHYISPRLFPSGFGVYVFFVISGFLITRLLLAEHKQTGRVSLPRFYARRALRLYPVVLTSTAVVLVDYLLTRTRINWIEPISALFYFANYHYSTIVESQPIRTMPFPLFWSLSVEEHFYFLLPTTLLLLRARPRWLLAAMAAVCVGCLGVRLTAASTHPELLDTRFFHYRTECRLDSLAYGVALAAACELPAWRRRILRLANPWTLCAGLAVIAFGLGYREPFFLQTWRFSVIGIGIVLAIVPILFRDGWIQKLLNRRPFTFVGELSYSLYVWSMVAPLMALWLVPHGSRAAVPLWFVLVFALASASYFLLEKPLLRLRHRFGSSG